MKYIHITFYWLKRLFLNLFYKKNFYCPQCLTKLKDGNYLITYETLGDHVSDPNGTPPKRPYFYCKNPACVLHGSPDITDENFSPESPFFDMYGGNDYFVKNKAVEDWRDQNERLSLYRPKKNWLLKKGVHALNSHDASYDLELCLKKTWFGKLYENWKQNRRDLIWERAETIVGEKYTFDASTNKKAEILKVYTKESRKLKYGILAIFKRNPKAVE